MGKKCGGGFLNANKRPLKYFENIIVFYNAQSTYNPQGLISVNRFHKRRGKTGVGSNYGNTVNEYVKKYENYPIDILYFDKEIGQTFHPTQKPVDLIRYLISTYTNEGETVLDNCIGSGTTAIAAIREHRNFIGFEINEEYFQKAKERIDIEISNPTL